MPKLQPGPVALYGQLAGIFRDKIRTGVWPGGYEIPTLEELTQEYSIARVTVRQAVQVLVQEGLLTSQRGRRTQVVHPGTAFDPTPLFTSINFKDSTTGDYGVKVLSTDTLDGKDVPSVFVGKFAGDYVLLRKIDYECGEPYSTSWHYIKQSLFERFPTNSPSVTKIARLIRDYGWSEFSRCTERISIRPADGEVARCLEIPVGSPVGMSQRIFLNGTGDIVYFGHLFFPGDKFGIERDITAAIRD